MKSNRSRNRHKNKSKAPKLSSEMLNGMDNLIFESFSTRTDVWNKKLSVPVNLFYKMLETMKINKDNKEFIQELKELTMLLSVDYSNVLIDDFAEIENLYFELSEVIDTICKDKKAIESNKQMALSLMDLYPFIMETIKNHEYLLIYPEKLAERIWE